MVHGTEPSGPEALGEHALYHWYRGSCGEWLFLAASLGHKLRPTAPGAPATSCYEDGALAALENCLADLDGGGGSAGGAPDLPLGNDAALRLHLASRFAQHPVDTLVSALEAAGVTCQKRFTMAQRRAQNVVAATSFSLPLAQPTFMFATDPSHPIGGEVTIFSPCAVRPSRCPVTASAPAPKFGAHSTEVLTEVLGYSASEAATLVAQGSAATGWSESYLPGGDPWAKQAEAYHAYVAQADAMGPKASKAAEAAEAAEEAKVAEEEAAAVAVVAAAVETAATAAASEVLTDSTPVEASIPERGGRGDPSSAKDAKQPAGLPAWVLPFAAGAALAALALRK